MPTPTIPATQLITDPGWLYRAPLGSTLPTNTVVGSVFTDSWPVAWVPQGLTDDGSEISSNTTVSPIDAAETFDPIAYRTTDRTGQVTFALKNITATNLSNAFNGGVLTVTGTTSTTLTRLDPVQPGQEIRCMIGWESLDSTVRWIGFQVFNSGDIKLSLKKAPANASIPWTGMLEKPALTQPSAWWFAGAARG